MEYVLFVIFMEVRMITGTTSVHFLELVSVMLIWTNSDQF